MVTNLLRELRFDFSEGTIVLVNEISIEETVYTAIQLIECHESRSYMKQNATKLIWHYDLKQSMHRVNTVIFSHVKPLNHVQTTCRLHTMTMRMTLHAGLHITVVIINSSWLEIRFIYKLLNILIRAVAHSAKIISTKTFNVPKQAVDSQLITRYITKSHENCSFTNDRKIARNAHCLQSIHVCHKPCQNHTKTVFLNIFAVTYGQKLHTSKTRIEL